MAPRPASSSLRTSPLGKPGRPWRRAAAIAAALVVAVGGATVAGGQAQAGAAPHGRVAALAGPQVALTSPTSGSYLVSVCAVRLAAEASTQSGTIARVEFFVNSQLVGSDARAPYGVDVPPGHPAFGSGVSGLRHAAFARVVTV